MTDTDLLDVLRRWWWALLLGTVVAALAGFFAASNATKTYEAQVRLLVGPINSSVDLDASGGLARTYADLATSEPVLRRALGAVRDPRTLDATKKNVSTTSNTITRIVTVAVRDHDARVAAELANLIGHGLRRLANRTPPRTITAIDDFARQPELAPLSGERRDAVLTAATRIFGASQSGRIQVVQDAAVPLRPASPSIPLMTLLAALVGCCIAAFFALVQEIRRRGQPSAAQKPGDAEPPPSAPPQLIRASSNAERALVEATAASPSAGTYRLLASRAGLLEASDVTRSLMVLESAGGSAAAVVAAELASAVAEEGRRVVVVDLGAAGSAVTDRLGLTGERGYANVVAGSAVALNGSLRGALVARGERLFVLPRGTAAVSHAHSVARLQSVLSGLEEYADVVIVAGPPLTRSAAVIAGVGTVDQVCLVVDSQDDGDELQRVVVSLERLDGRFVGAVLRGGQAPRRTRTVVRAS